MCSKAAAHQTSPTACVRKSEPSVREFTQEVRSFATTCAELLALRDWLRTRFGGVFVPVDCQHEGELAVSGGQSL
jgi:hypothetical protein